MNKCQIYYTMLIHSSHIAGFGPPPPDMPWEASKHPVKTQSGDQQGAHVAGRGGESPEVSTGI